jgi:Carboxypeptidase regulatory-like domain
MIRHIALSMAAVLALQAAPIHAQTAAPPKLLPGTKSGVFSTITGKAVSETNAPMAGSLIRLRDVRFGPVVATTTTDKAGQFEFKNVDTGSYLVELMSPSGEMLASSSLLYVDSGENLTTILRIPPSHPRLGSLLTAGTAVAAGAAAAAVTAAAASSNTPAATNAGVPATSQNPTQH